VEVGFGQYECRTDEPLLPEEVFHFVDLAEALLQQGFEGLELN